MRTRTHPGEMLSEEFLKPLKISANALSKELGVPQNRISEIIRGRRNVTADTARRLAAYFGNTAQFWLNVQTGYDLSLAEAEHADEYASIKQIDMPATHATG